MKSLRELLGKMKRPEKPNASTLESFAKIGGTPIGGVSPYSQIHLIDKETIDISAQKSDISKIDIAIHGKYSSSIQIQEGDSILYGVSNQQMINDLVRNQINDHYRERLSGTFTGRFCSSNSGNYSNPARSGGLYMIRVGNMAYDVSSLSDYLMYPEEVKTHKDVIFTEEPNVSTNFCRCGICMNKLEPIPSGEESNYNLSVKTKTELAIGVIKVCITCLAKLRLAGRILPYKKGDTMFGFGKDRYKKEVRDFLEIGFITNVETQHGIQGSGKVIVEIAIP